VALEVWGKDVIKPKRLRELEMENGKLKRLLAHAHLDIHALKSVFGTFDPLDKM
jgi:putative transposase